MVTGGSGYIASWIIHELLNAGHNVHATVRNPKKEASVKHLKKIANEAPGILRLFKADLLDKSSFDAPMEGCDTLIHTASPFILEGFKDANEALVRPALEGTRNVLNAANRCKSLKRVVLTSSVVSIYGDATEIKGKKEFTEHDWNITSTANHNPYPYSKVIAEREAWKICKSQSNWDMVTINPGMVYGPSLTNATNSASVGTLIDMGRGKMRHGVPKLVYGVVDVRDVANAHILAAFSPNANGRYILVNESISLLDTAFILKEKFGNTYNFPQKELPKALVWLVGPLIGPVTRRFILRNVGYDTRFNNSRSKSLGVNYRSISKTLSDHFSQVIRDGLLKPN